MHTEAIAKLFSGSLYRRYFSTVFLASPWILEHYQWVANAWRLIGLSIHENKISKVNNASLQSCKQHIELLPCS